ncbi:hypothetical protein [Fructilactobacillus fructivorans]|uniref:Uncharacterized protein n=1 Tax=Fructilactobacillus fructivorans TaxID=1614 RepID=A0A0C1LYN2_9LACO|nr:hypothetical protein [Fructilactobacillus fructivorans]KID41990.1 hypothetical protein LfDm3_0658 [Fructilactobacillus fructivorans]MCT0151647.1 hypothetical protein [Fructilactobacillus fructivorans]MCT2867224.1 hypothetical protein [Fructilactobacillus fructivorans]MCT2868215.1 hypothetical protein [Fructilactobacillus fructivorans]MCT2872923.1 hypothetical protein [Fructilactobacillus fructivorans]
MNNSVDQVVKDLRYSMNNNLLVNLTQQNTTVFYTGVVVALDAAGAILITYDDYGLANGLVYVVYGDIDDIDFQSEDLTKMEGRIRMSRQLKLNGTKQEVMKLNSKNDLLTQILGNSFVDQQAIMVVTQDGNSVEGFINSLSDFEFSLSVIDKFDNENVTHKTIIKPLVRSVEFLGTELKLLTDSKSVLFAKHIDPQVVDGQLAIEANLYSAMETGRRIVMIPNIHSDLFFIGQIRAVNSDSVIFSLVDMMGRFGGYELIKIDEIDKLVIKSDYLRLINHFVSINSANGVFVQPVLNNDRSFDATVNLFAATIEMAIKFQRVVRIKMNDGQSYLGFPVKYERGQVTVQIVDKAKLFVVNNQLINLNDIDEIAFGYLDSYLIEQQIG